ncbi:MAG: phosphohistidine phosphatase SixA [Akkermansiaceae bacterium]
MELLLIRHAKAEPHSLSDAERALTDSGREQAQKVGRFLLGNDLVPDLTLASPLVRARQTAEIVCEVSGASSPTIEPWLACGMRPGTAIQELASYRDFARVAIVGHNPDFEYFAQWLLGGQCGGVHVRKASVIYFSHLNPPAQGAYLEMMLPVSVL